MNSLGVAVVGCGNMGKDLAKAAATVKTIRVAAVCDVDEGKRTALSEEIGCDAEGDLASVLSRDDIEAVIVATPPHFHEAATVAAAEAGLHVFCEKPLAPTLSGCDRILQAVDKAGVVLAVGLVCRYLPVHKKVKELVVAGTVGAPVSMSVHRLSGAARGRWHAPWRMLMETNAHEIDFIRNVMDDEVVEVSAAGGTYVHTAFDYPDETFVTLRFKNGGVGHLHSSYISAIGAYGGRVHGDNGTVAFPAIWGSIDEPIRYQSGDEEEVKLTSADLELSEGGVAAELRVFAEVVWGGASVGASGIDGRAATEIALAAYRSIETGRSVALPIRDEEE
jgi:myo-inositol 2-dehydrogenase/D-chiro-inositol 1-dehydrogenase